MSLIQSLKNELKVLRDLMHNRIFVSPETEADVVREFHKLYYNSHSFSKTFGKTSWLGVPALKCPLDLWVYQELIYSQKPDLLIETGTCEGGSALFLASMCDLVGKGQVVTIDIEHRNGRPVHPRIKYLHGSSTDKKILSEVRSLLGSKGGRAIVFLDSDHRKEHVLKELDAYKDFVPKGSYLIVEDTNINNHPVYPDFGAGPMEAVEDFLKKNQDFVIDKEKEKFYLTFNPKGFLLKVR